MNNNGETVFEVRLGDTISDNGVAPSGPTTTINLRVTHGFSTHQIQLPAQSTFGDLKRLLAIESGLEPRDQRVYFRGKEMNEEECLHKVGVKDRSKLLLMEDNAS